MANGCSYECNKHHFGFTDTESNTFYSSWCCQNRIVFALYRGVFFFFALAWIIADVVVIHEDNYVIYLTNWTEVTGCIYFAVAFLVSLYGCTEHSRKSTELRWFHCIQWILFNVSFSAALVGDIIFWVFLSSLLSKAALVSPFNIHSHVINFVMLLIDLLVSRFPIRMLHFIYPSSYAFVYLFFTLILHWSNTRSAVYSILHWSRNPGLAAGLSVATIFVAVPIAHLIAFGLYHLREVIFKHRCKQNEATSSSEMEMGEHNLGYE